MSKIAPVISPVDYDAWGRGYMPPSEHILIDALAYRGAKVILSTDNGEGKGAFWLVIRDKNPPKEQIRKVMDALFCDWDEGKETVLESGTLTVRDQPDVSETFSKCSDHSLDKS